MLIWTFFFASDCWRKRRTNVHLVRTTIDIGSATVPISKSPMHTANDNYYIEQVNYFSQSSTTLLDHAMYIEGV